MAITDPEIGTGVNQISTFAIGNGANVKSPTDWEADTVRQQGFVTGLADPQQCNTVLRQASFIMAMIAQFSADFSGSAALDDDDLPQAEQNFIDALRKIFRGVFFITDTGTANAVIGTTTPIPTAYDTKMLIVLKKMNAANTGAMTANFWGLGAVALTDNTGATLSAGAMLASSYYILTYDGTGFRVLGGVAQYTSVTNLTANSGDMVAVTSGSGVMDFRTLRGTHNANIQDLDRWPRGDASTDIGLYCTSLEFLAWITSHLTGGGSIVGMQIITASGTYTKTAGTNKALVFATGGGGGGANSTRGDGDSGGGAGGTAIKFVDLSGVNTVACTIGAGGAMGGDGGATSFGAYAAANGGLAPDLVQRVGGEWSYGPYGGGGGQGTTGQALIYGGEGDCDYSGSGGMSFWGGGGGGGYALSDSATKQIGLPGQAYGSGGGSQAAGKSGVILVVEFA